MEAIVKVGRLWMDNRMYRAGEVIDIPEERIAQLGTSVEHVVPTIEELDERDVEIEALKAKVEELETSLDVVTTNVEPSVESVSSDEGKKPAQKRGRK